MFMQDKMSGSMFLLLSSVSMIMNEFLYSLNSGLILEFILFKPAGQEFMFTILIDKFSCIFFSLVMLISGCIIFYSKFYMTLTSSNRHFLFLVCLFVGSMTCLIFSVNLISIILGWDGLGLISFILVAFYQSSDSKAASQITFLTNRMGDAALLLAIGIAMEFNSWDFFKFYDSQPILSIFVLFAAFTKSAQFPFSAWLPAAMAAPTPVSALVHSSTLVTAGVYFMIRFSQIMPSFQLKIMFLCGMMTCLLASLSAMVESDLKKIIALSTLSQLGMMTFSLSQSLEISFLHMLIHASFKALMFMSAGKSIYSTCNFQDIRKTSSTIVLSPLSIIHFNLANLSLCGFPFLPGFYSKDTIFECILWSPNNMFMYILLIVSIFCTVIYATRMMVFVSILPQVSTQPLLNLEDSNNQMTKSSFMLFMSSFFLSPMLMKSVITPNPLMLFTLKVKLLPLIMFCFGILSLILIFQPYMSNKTRAVKSMDMWFLPDISSQFLLFKFWWIMSKHSKIIEMGWMEILIKKMSKDTVNMSIYPMNLKVVTFNSIFSMFIYMYMFI